MLNDFYVFKKIVFFCRVRISSNVDYIILVGMGERWSQSMYVLHIMIEMGPAPIRGDPTLYANKYS